MTSLVSTRCGALWALALAVVAATLTSAYAPVTAEAQMSLARQPLSAAERSRLSRGELVVRATSERRGSLSLMGGVSFQVIDAAPDSVWTALADVRQWRRMLPQVSESREVGHAGNARTIYLRQGSGAVSAAYYLTAQYQEGTHDVVFMLDANRHNDIRAAWGFLSIREWAGGQTIVTYGVMADLGAGLIGNLVGSAVQEWMLKVPWTMKQHLEALMRRGVAHADPSRG